MSKMLSMVLAACLLAFPFATFAGTDYGSQSPQTQQSPPVAQPLVREGDFAMKLALDLNLGNPSDEAAAEDLLSSAGIRPANGWISDYPITPEIIAQLNDSLMYAASEGTLPVSYEEAQQTVSDLVQELNLPIPAEGGTQTGRTPATTAAVSDYFAAYGPPVVTYYAPPVAYAYMYDWVPFPVFWFGIAFPGFFICHHFTTTVVVSPFFGSHHHGRAIVTNRFVNPVTHTAFFVDHHGFADHHGFRNTGPALGSHRTFQSGTGRTFTMPGRTFGSMGRSPVFGSRTFSGPMHSFGGRAMGGGGFGHGMGRGR